MDNDTRKPTLIIGWPTIALLAHGLTVELENAILIPDDLLFNTASKIIGGNLLPCNCTEPRQVICNGHRCGFCGKMIHPNGVKEHPVEIKEESKWMSVMDYLPPNNAIVETKIEDQFLGDWCFIKRKYVDGTWDDVTYDGKWRARLPTHWKY